MIDIGQFKNMKNRLLLKTYLGFFVSVYFSFFSNALALESGVWRGVISQQASCYFDLLRDTSELNQPLTLLQKKSQKFCAKRKVTIEVGRKTFELRHPIEFQFDLGQVVCNMDKLVGTVETETGILAAGLQLISVNGKEQIQAFDIMDLTNNNQVSEKIHCDHIERVSE